MADSTNREYQDALSVLQNVYSSAPRLAVLGPVCAEFGFFEEFPALQAAFEALYGFFRAFKELPTTTVLRQDVEALGIAKGLTEVHMQAISAQAQEWLGKRIVNDGPVEAIIKAFREDRLRNKLQEKLETDHLASAIDGVYRAIHTDPFQRAKEENPFTNPEAYLATTKPYSFGVRFLDDAMDGGARLGETVSLLAPSGGGKTTIGLQIAERQVYEHRHVIYIATEQKLKGDIALRCFVLATDKTRTDWKDGYDRASPAVKAAYDRVKEPWLKYFHFYDISKLQPDSIDSLYAPVAEQIAKGNQPVYVIFDWWGDIRDALIDALENKRMDSADIRRYARGWLKEIINKATELQVINFILHQLSGSAASKSSERLQSSHDAQEDKNFNNRFDFAFTFSKKGAQDSVNCRVDKARRNRNATYKLRLDGEHCRFHYLGDANSSAGEMIDEVCDDHVANNYLPIPKEGSDA